MASARYQPNNAGFQEMALGPEVRAVLMAVGQKAKAIAEGLSQDFRVTGEYAGAFALEEDTSPLGRNRHAMVRLVNNSPHAAAVEWGSSRDRKPHRVLGRTLDLLKDA